MQIFEVNNSPSSRQNQLQLQKDANFWSINKSEVEKSTTVNQRQDMGQNWRKKIAKVPKSMKKVDADHLSLFFQKLTK